jgi:hypothetical protein
MARGVHAAPTRARNHVGCRPARDLLVLRACGQACRSRDPVDATCTKVIRLRALSYAKRPAGSPQVA